MARLPLAPLPDVPFSARPSWQDLVRLAPHEPAAQHVLELVQAGRLTREEALIWAVFVLYGWRRKHCTATGRGRHPRCS